MRLKRCETLRVDADDGDETVWWIQHDAVVEKAVCTKLNQVDS